MKKYYALFIVILLLSACATIGDKYVESDSMTNVAPATTKSHEEILLARASQWRVTNSLRVSIRSNDRDVVEVVEEMLARCGFSVVNRGNNMIDFPLQMKVVISEQGSKKIQITLIRFGPDGRAYFFDGFSDHSFIRGTYGVALREAALSAVIKMIKETGAGTSRGLK